MIQSDSVSFFISEPEHSLDSFDLLDTVLLFKGVFMKSNLIQHLQTHIKVPFLVVLAFFISLWGTNVHSFSATVSPTSYIIPQIKVTLVGKTYNNTDFKYPILLIDNQVYFPLTWEMTQTLGFDANYTVETGLILKKRTSIGSNMITTRSLGDLAISGSTNIVTYPVRALGYPLYSELPIYNLSGVTYVALDHTPILNAVLTGSVMNNITIAPDLPVYMPLVFNTYNQFDASAFVRDQGSAATCWAFAANTLFELSIAVNTGKVLDFSEAHLLDNAPMPVSPLSGGNFNISSTYFLNGLGPIDTNGHQNYRLTGYSEVNNDLIKIKSNIMKYGAVLSSIYLNESDTSVYKQDTFAYYNSSENKPCTHELVIVGWDDTYDKSNFQIKPTRNGAFIAQNSFGNSWGDNGFFYISYEDVHIMDYTYAITDYDTSLDHTTLYYYDETGVTHFDAYEDENPVFGVNQFTAKAASKLISIGVYTTESDERVSIFAGKGIFANAIGTELNTVTLREKGYHEIELPAPLTLTSKEGFWIAARFEGTQSFLVPIEAPYPGIDYTIKGLPGRSFIGNGERFEDITQIWQQGSIAIRAITQ